MGEVALAPHLGKALTLLAWSVEQEDAEGDRISKMLANWLGLVPEERWWLYTTVNATFEHPEHGPERGWRKAIKIAFVPGVRATPPYEVAPTPGEVREIQRRSRVMSDGDVTISKDLASRVARGELTIDEAIRRQKRHT